MIIDLDQLRRAGWHVDVNNTTVEIHGNHMELSDLISTIDNFMRGHDIAEHTNRLIQDRVCDIIGEEIITAALREAMR